MAEGVLRSKLDSEKHQVDSAGTAAFHEGERPDLRTLRTCRKHQVNMDAITARQFQSNDFDRFDRIYVMDKSNLENVLKLARNKQDEEKVDLLLNVSYPGKNMEVPDPYFGGQDGFEHIFELINEVCDRIAEEIE
jgi:protein-tyrosine phosphatase